MAPVLSRGGRGCISLQRQKSSYKRDVGVKRLDVCSFFFLPPLTTQHTKA